jgi:hypothetical protein
VIRGRLAVCAVLVLLIVAPGRAVAQTFEAVGNRAQGMGGAFVAVADDATATWWNPAGLATLGAPSAIFERGEWTDPAKHPATGPVVRNRDTSFAVSFPGIGLSYYRVNLTDVWPLALPAEGADAPQSSLRKFVLSQYGATTGRSIGGIIAISSTLKLIQVGATDGVSVASADRLKEADALDVPLESKGDIDLGAMALLGRLRIGFTMKHVLKPEFDSTIGPIVLDRQSRIGAAFRTGAPAGVALTVAFDADLTRTPTRFGDVRHMAIGAEGVLRRWLGVRGGYSTNTIGDARPSWSGGLSLGASGFFVDAALTFGSDTSKEGWNVGVRLAL